jgi:hypothetical protein
MVGGEIVHQREPCVPNNQPLVEWTQTSLMPVVDGKAHRPELHVGKPIRLPRPILMIAGGGFACGPERLGDMQSPTGIVHGHVILL